MSSPVDPVFLALPLKALADAALQTARSAGAEHADLRVERLRHQNVSLRDAALENLADDVTLGIAVRVGHHCAAPVCKRYGVAATTRASSYVYNNEADVDALLAGIVKVQEFWG